jgi:hypothetical protein
MKKKETKKNEREERKNENRTLPCACASCTRQRCFAVCSCPERTATKVDKIAKSGVAYAAGGCQTRGCRVREGGCGQCGSE